MPKWKCAISSHSWIFIDGPRPQGDHDPQLLWWGRWGHMYFGQCSISTRTKGGSIRRTMVCGLMWKGGGGVEAVRDGPGEGCNLIQGGLQLGVISVKSGKEGNGFARKQSSGERDPPTCCKSGRMVNNGCWPWGFLHQWATPWISCESLRVTDKKKQIQRSLNAGCDMWWTLTSGMMVT